LEQVYVGRHLLTAEVLGPFCRSLKVVIIVDRAVRDLYGTKLAQQLGGELLTVASGETAKTKDTVEQLLEAFFKMGLGRDTMLIALGGGVTTDLVGFVASIYMRGLPLILIPTTLLAMVDAAIGGKTAINTSFGKNLIGTIYPPSAIFADLETLKTLPEKEWLNGLAEILKIGLVQDADLCWLAQQDRKDSELISKAIQAKIDVVEQDIREQGIRHILNFGHTIGHGLESMSNYLLAHGEAVAMGSLVEAHLSWQLGYLTENSFLQIKKWYECFSLQLPSNYDRHRFFQAMLHDKKKSKGELRFVLIDQIGHAVPFEGAFCRTVSLQELEPSLVWMESVYG
jgi:3-dehydroquinate synthase